MKLGWHILLALVLSALALGAEKKPKVQDDEPLIAIRQMFYNLTDGDSVYHLYHRAVMNEVGNALANQSDKAQKTKKATLRGQWTVTVVLAYGFKDSECGKQYSLVVQSYRTADQEKDKAPVLQYCSAIDEKSNAPEEGRTIAKLSHEFFLKMQNGKIKKKR